MAEKDYSVLVAAFVALVAIVGLVTQLGGSGSGALSASYGSYKPENPSLQRGTCPQGYTATNIVCDTQILVHGDPHPYCYNTADLYCVPDNQYFGAQDAQPPAYGQDPRIVAHSGTCVLTPSDEEGASYYLCS